MLRGCALFNPQLAAQKEEERKKKEAAAAEERAKAAAKKRPRAGKSGSPFVSGGDKYDPLNGNL